LEILPSQAFHESKIKLLCVNLYFFGLADFPTLPLVADPLLLPGVAVPLSPSIFPVVGSIGFGLTGFAFTVLLLSLSFREFVVVVVAPSRFVLFISLSCRCEL
jgi:hypothetical protein